MFKKKSIHKCPHLFCLLDDLALLFFGKSRFQSLVGASDVSGFLGDVNVDPGKTFFPVKRRINSPIVATIDKSTTSVP